MIRFEVDEKGHQLLHLDLDFAAGSQFRLELTDTVGTKDLLELENLVAIFPNPTFE